MWSMTIGEFLDYVDGFRAAERDRDFMLAIVATSFGGGDAHRLIGETPPGNSDITKAEGWAPTDPTIQRLIRQREYDTIARREREAAHVKWMPARIRSLVTLEEQEELEAQESR